MIIPHESGREKNLEVRKGGGEGEWLHTFRPTQGLDRRDGGKRGLAVSSFSVNVKVATYEKFIRTQGRSLQQSRQ